MVHILFQAWRGLFNSNPLKVSCVKVTLICLLALLENYLIQSGLKNRLRFICFLVGLSCTRCCTVLNFTTRRLVDLVIQLDLLSLTEKRLLLILHYCPHLLYFEWLLLFAWQGVLMNKVAISHDRTKFMLLQIDCTCSHKVLFAFFYYLTIL